MSGALPGRALLVLAAGLALAGCGEPRHVEGLAPVAGDSLFEQLDAVEVVGHPGTCLAPELAQRVRAAGPEPAWSLEAAAWSPRGDRGVSPAQRTLARSLVLVYASLFDGAGGVQLWHASPPVTLDPALAPWWMEHDGRRLESASRGAAATGERRLQQTWADREAELLIWWDLERQELVALGRQEPADLRLGCHPARSELGRLERWLVEDLPPPARAQALWTRRSLGRDDRPCLVLPAPARLSVAVAELDAEALDVVVGLPDVRFGAAREYVRQLPADELSLTFAVEWVLRGATRRLWTRQVSSIEGWVAERVDLSGLRGRAGTLVLRCLREEGDQARAYGLWSGLRFRDRQRGRPERPHLLLIDVDTLRADRLGIYGHDRPTSPRLDAWAAEQAVVFEDATAPGNWTLPSTVSLLTGLEVDQHGVRDETRSLSAAVPSLARLLADAGYETWARTDGGYVVPSFGLAQGFDRFHTRMVPRWNRSDSQWQDARDWLEQRGGDRPVFLFLQTYQVHTPLLRDRRFDDPEQPYAGRLDQEMLTDPELIEAQRERPLSPREQQWVGALYDAGVARMDEDLGAFLQALPGLFGDEPYLLLFTSDHGEELYDRGRFGHRRSLHTELLHVPLILRHPDGAVAGRSAAPVTLLDVVPTLLDAADVPAPPGLPGHSLLGQLPERRLRVADDRGQAVALEYDGRKLVLPLEDAREQQDRQLFDRRSDPHERQDLLDEDPHTATRLAELWDLHRQRFPPRAQAADSSASLDDAARADLQALGYAGDDGR